MQMRTETRLKPSCCRSTIARMSDCMLVRDARDDYFTRYGLTPQSYTEDWTFLWFGPVPVLLRNTAGRKRALPAHDLHHVVTGCDAVWNQGELEVTAYEVRSGGCGWMP